MHRRHVAALDAEEVVQHLGDRGQGVGGARAVGNDDVVCTQCVVVDLEDNGLVGAVGGRRDQHALGTGGQVRRGLVLGREDAGAFKGDVDVQVLVRQVRRITLGRDLDLAQAHVDPVVAALDRAGKTAVDRIVAQQVRIGRHRPQVVDRHNLDVAAAMLGDGAKNKAADAAEAVDGDADGHGVSPEAELLCGASMERARARCKCGAVTRRDRGRRRARRLSLRATGSPAGRCAVEAMLRHDVQNYCAAACASLGAVVTSAKNREPIVAARKIASMKRKTAVAVRAVRAPSAAASLFSLISLVLLGLLTQAAWMHAT